MRSAPTAEAFRTKNSHRKKKMTTRHRGWFDGKKKVWLFPPLGVCWWRGLSVTWHIVSDFSSVAEIRNDELHLFPRFSWHRHVITIVYNPLSLSLPASHSTGIEQSVPRWLTTTFFARSFRSSILPTGTPCGNQVLASFIVLL